MGGLSPSKSAIGDTAHCLNGLEGYAQMLEVLKSLSAAASDEAIDRLLPWHQDESLYAFKPSE